VYRVAPRPSLIIIGAGLAGAALLLVVARREVGSPPQLEAVVSDFDAQLRETAAAAQARASTLAELPRLAWAVATDEATVRNLTGEELAFRPQPNETIEISQINRRSSKETTLLHSPAGTKVRAPLNSPGMHLLVVGEQLHLAAVVSIEPKVRADALRGAVSVSRKVDLSRIEKHVNDLGLALRYDCAAGNRLVIGSATQDRLHAIEMPLANEAAKGGKLWVMAPEQRSNGGGLLTGAAVAVLLGSFVWAGLLLRRPPPPVAAPLAAVEPLPIANWQPAPPANTGSGARLGAPTAPSPTPVPPLEEDPPLLELVPESHSNPVPASVMMRLTASKEREAVSAVPSRPPKPRTNKP
jgi:hypothetical protein